MAVEILEALVTLWQHVDLVPSPELIGRAVGFVALDRRRKDRGMGGMVFGPVLKMAKRQKIGMRMLVRRRAALSVRHALPPHRSAPARQRVVPEIIHAVGYRH